MINVEAAVVVGEIAVGLYDFCFNPFEEAGFVGFYFKCVPDFFAI